ncbi:Crp/Fnr family transcriptional regulator [Bacteroidota bacterium]
MEADVPYCIDCIDNKGSLFYQLKTKEKDLLQAGHSQRLVKKGEIIFREGEFPVGIMCLTKGKVKIFKSGIGGREQIVHLVRPIDLMGYRALFSDECFCASAVALEDSIVCEIYRDNIFSVVKHNPGLSLKIIKYFANELGLSNNRTITLTQKHIRGRLAESLLFLEETYGFEDDFATIQAYLSREDLANLSNMTTSNAIRTLSIFASENVISIDGRRIKILDKNKLERISELG